MPYNQHDERDCECIHYRPDFSVFELKLTEGNYYCAKCDRYVTIEKWKGGIIHFSNRTRFVAYFRCPCCGERMRRGRRGKNRLLKSIKNQTDHPEEYSAFVLSKLKSKQKLLRENKLIPTVMP